MKLLEDNPPPQNGCFWTGVLLVLVALLISFGMCSNLHLGTH